MNQKQTSRVQSHGIERLDDPTSISIPEGHVGPIVLSSGRMIYWTGRVAIGLRHQPARREHETLSHGAAWIQNVMLRSRTPSAHAELPLMMRKLGGRLAALA